MRRRGSHTTARELQTCTFQGPCASKTPPKFHEKTPRERQNERKWGTERAKKKSEISGPPPFGAPTLRGATFSRFGLPLFGAPPRSRPPPFGAPPRGHPSGPHHSSFGLMFFLSRLSFFWSRMLFFILSRQQVAHFVPFQFFFVPWRFFFVPTPIRHPPSATALLGSR